jgi:hypothetical protein
MKGVQNLVIAFCQNKPAENIEKPVADIWKALINNFNVEDRFVLRIVIIAYVSR